MMFPRFLLYMSAWQIARKAAVEVFFLFLGVICLLAFGAAFCLYFVNL